jgi:hypothetical protein
VVSQAEKEQEDCDMTGSSVVDERASGFASFHATQAEVLTMRITGRPRGDGTLIDVVTCSDGEFTLSLGLGIDTAGTVHDPAGRVTFSFQVIPRPPGPFPSLSAADLDSLAAALTTC